MILHSFFNMIKSHVFPDVYHIQRTRRHVLQTGIAKVVIMVVAEVY